MPGAGKKATPRRAATGGPAAGGRARSGSSRGNPGKPAAAKKPPARKAAPTPPAAKTAKRAPAKAVPTKKPAAKKAPAPRPAAKRLPAKPAPAPKATTKAAAPARAATATRPAAPGAGETRSRSGKKTVICPLSGFEVTPGPANLSPKTLERLRQKLVDEKNRLHHQAEELTAEAEQLAREREAGDTQFDEESGEGDTVNIERERDLLLSATARQVVEEIDDALERMKRNRYGVCKPAGRKIALERLEAIPWAQVCVDCKARAERRR
jgi:RNA polymerase-binding protein DksA